MERPLFLSAVITFVLVQALPIAAQKVHTQEVIRKELPAKEGKIIVYLPNDIRSGDVISGTVTTEPNGNNEKEKNRNNDALKNYTLTIGQKIIALKDRLFSLQIPSGSSMTLELKNSRGETGKKDDIVLSSITMSDKQFVPPPYFVSGEPAQIKGQFDGLFNTTSVKLNGTSAELIAESPRHVYFKSSPDLKGNVQLECTEKGVTTSAKSNALQLDMSADKLNLQRGEKTTLHIKVSGLEGLKESVPLTIQNQSPSTVSLDGGNIQQITIQPNQAGTSGIYQTNRGIQSLKDGNFTVTANIISPSTATSGGSLLCNCFIGIQTFLLPPETCQKLGGECGTGVPATTDIQTPVNPGSVPVLNVTVPKEMDPRTGQISLQLTSLNDNISAVIFSEKPVGSTEWRKAGKALKKGNTWESNWTTPLGNDGLYTIRARVVSKDNLITEKFVHTTVVLTPLALSPSKNERITLSISQAQVTQAEEKARQTADSLNAQQEKITELERKLQESKEQAEEKRQMADELATIDKTLDKISTVYRDSLKALIDSLKKLQGNLPPQPDQQALQQYADDAAQRLKDCLDRLEKLKQEKADLEKQRDDLKAQQDALLNQMDQLHLGNGWIGGHGYWPSGLLWYGYVGDESSNTNIDGQARALEKQMRPLNKAYMNALKRLKNLDAEIADAEKECDKLKKESDEAAQAAQNNSAAQAVAGQVDELNRQIQSLLDALREWCAAHPGMCKFEGELATLNGGSPLSPAALTDFLDKINDVIAQKQQLESDLEKAADEAAANAANTGAALDSEKEKAQALADELAKQQAEADRLREEREKQLEAERAAQRKKQEEEHAKLSTPKPQPTLPEPVNPSDDQLKFQAQRLFRDLYTDYLISKGPCDCITKAIALANNTNTVVSDIIGGIAVGVAFAPLEALPGASFGARLGIGAAKALASALFAGQNFSEELAKNLFNVIGGEVFPHLTGDEFTGNRLNELASGGLDAILKAEGVRSTSWEGETELRGCGKVKGKTVILFNPNTGWVVIMIKIDNCPLIVIKYKVNKDGVPITKPTVQKVSG